MLMLRLRASCLLLTQPMLGLNVSAMSLMCGQQTQLMLMLFRLHCAQLNHRCIPNLIQLIRMMLGCCSAGFKQVHC